MKCLPPVCRRRVEQGVGVLLLWPILTACPAWSQMTPVTCEPVVRHLINDSKPPGSTVTCSIFNLETGQVWASIGAEDPMIPASNMKLLTSGAALQVLGTEFRFETRFVKVGDDTLVLVGSGDPGLADPELLPEMGIEVETLINRWLDGLTPELGQEIATFVVDDRIFESRFVHPTWEAEDLQYAYGAQVSGFNFFGNCVNFYAWPSRNVGSAPIVRVEPDVMGWLRFQNTAKSRNAKGQANEVYVRRGDELNSFLLGGVINRAQAAPIKITIDDPAEFYARHIAYRLNDRGVQVDSWRSADDDDPLPFVGQAIGTAIVTPMATILRRCNTDSENLYAESLLKRIGHEVTDQPGSWENGSAVVRMLVSKHLGPSAAMNVRLVDGSGLSRDNRLTTGVIGGWLQSMYSQETLRDLYVESLGTPDGTGTLKKRFDGVELKNKVRAKSGYISGVSCLSGYVIGPSGQGVAFSIMCNNVERGEVTAAKELQEKIVALLDEMITSREAQTVEVDESKAAPKLGG